VVLRTRVFLDNCAVARLRPARPPELDLLPRSTFEDFLFIYIQLHTLVNIFSIVVFQKEFVHFGQQHPLFMIFLPPTISKSSDLDFFGILFELNVHLIVIIFLLDWLPAFDPDFASIVVIECLGTWLCNEVALGRGALRP